jgi:hypothetical protein
MVGDCTTNLEAERDEIIALRERATPGERVMVLPPSAEWRPGELW